MGLHTRKKYTKKPSFKLNNFAKKINSRIVKSCFAKITVFVRLQPEIEEVIKIKLENKER
jgi:hypothetical protein